MHTVAACMYAGAVAMQTVTAYMYAGAVAMQTVAAYMYAGQRVQARGLACNITKNNKQIAQDMLRNLCHH